MSFRSKNQKLDLKISLRSYTCKCPHNRTGKRCEKEIEPCEYNPCRNRGHCKRVDGSVGFECQCPEHFTGFLCEIENVTELTDKKTCMPSCKNGGVCKKSSIGEYSCECLNGYTGSYCEHEIDHCYPSGMQF